MRLATVESLETRTFLSAAPIPGDVSPMKKSQPAPAAVTCSLKKGQLVVYGTPKNDDIRTAESKSTLSVQVRGKGNKYRTVFATKMKNVKTIVVYAGNGDDKVTLRDVGFYTENCLAELGRGNDFCQGSDRSDAINGGAGDDEIQGFDGADYLGGMDGNDKVFGGAGNDTLDGDHGTDTIVGGAGDDELDARDGQYNDYISGDSGNDTAYADKQVFGGVDYWETDNIFAKIEHYST